jgi:hypothetical protein
MGKKNKNKTKSIAKRTWKSILTSKIFWAALGGVAAGIALASALGSEKAKHLVGSVGDSVKSLTARVKESQTALNN